jgi:hypothetical protein
VAAVQNLPAVIPTVHQDKRTTVQIPVHQDPSQTILAWAKRKQFYAKGNLNTPSPTRTFQRGTGLMVAPMMLTTHIDGGLVTLQAWVRIPMFTRIFSFFMLPSEMHVRSGGFRAVAPRKIARDAINELIRDLGGQPIP